jgi:hypothetical protein
MVMDVGPKDVGYPAWRGIVREQSVPERWLNGQLMQGLNSSLCTPFPLKTGIAPRQKCVVLWRFWRHFYPVSSPVCRKTVFVF